MNAIHLAHAAELYTTSGPTGRYVEVIRGEVRDYGGNVLFAGSADDCVRDSGEWKLPTRLVPTEWREVAGDVVGADNHWQLVM